MDQQEFKKIIDIYYKRLAYYVYRMVSNDVWAQEITNDCFLKLWESKDNFKSEKEIWSFLFMHAKNATISHLTRIKRAGEYTQLDFAMNEIADELTIKEKKSSEVIIYIPEKPSLFDQENIVNACGEFMEALGYEMKTEDEPIYNSFWQKIKFIFKRNITEKDVNDLFYKGKKALELKYVELPTAEQTEKLANATEKIMNSIEKFDNCTIRLGSLLIVKRKGGTESVLKIHQLSLEEIKNLEENNSIIKDVDPLTLLSILTGPEHFKKASEELAAHILPELNASSDTPPLAAEDEVKDAEPLSGSLHEPVKKEDTIGLK